MTLTSTSARSSSALTANTNALTSDQAITINVFSDGPSLTLAAGTWYLSGFVTVLNGASGGTANVKLWDGTTVYAASESAITGSSRGTVAVSTVAVLAAGATLKLSAAFNAAGATLKATPTTNATGETNLGSILSAVRIA